MRQLCGHLFCKKEALASPKKPAAQNCESLWKRLAAGVCKGDSLHGQSQTVAHLPEEDRGIAAGMRLKPAGAQELP